VNQNQKSVQECLFWQSVDFFRNSKHFKFHERRDPIGLNYYLKNQVNWIISSMLEQEQESASRTQEANHQITNRNISLHDSKESLGYDQRT